MCMLWPPTLLLYVMNDEVFKIFSMYKGGGTGGAGQAFAGPFSEFASHFYS